MLAKRLLPLGALSKWGGGLTSKFRVTRGVEQRRGDLLLDRDRKDAEVGVHVLEPVPPSHVTPFGDPF